jgi:hypothetical protein
MDAVSRRVLFAIPPKGGSLRDALPVVERLCRAHAGERAEVMLGWGTEPLDGQWQAFEVGIGEIAPCMERWEAEGRLQLGEGDVHLDGPGCRFLFCHDADLHIESSNPALLAEARAALEALRWRCVEAAMGGRDQTER